MNITKQANGTFKLDDGGIVLGNYPTQEEAESAQRDFEFSDVISDEIRDWAMQMQRKYNQPYDKIIALARDCLS